MSNLTMAEQVIQRAKELLQEKVIEPLDPQFVAKCLANNERGDGVMYSVINGGKFIFNTTPLQGGEWLAWQGNVWKVDHTRRSFAAVENCALEYQRVLDKLKNEIIEEGIDKKSDDAWKLKVKDKYQSRVDRLRGENGAMKALVWAPVVDTALSCRESDFDQIPNLLPVKNGVINLETGFLESGRPEDKLTKALDIDYDPRADYAPWVQVLDELTGDPEITAFIKRSFGYACSGFSHEQYIWIFNGPGRNGKGILFSMIAAVLGPYYHEINTSMLIEQRNEPSPSAASEHKYSLLSKRVIVAAETNKGQKIDVRAVKNLTGDDIINCRPNFKAEMNFRPTHTTFLHCNHILRGLTSDFAILQRLIMIEFPHMYVDDVEAEKKKYPGQADKFRKKDPYLKAKLTACLPGILTWMVEGYREYKEIGLAVPQSIIDKINNYAKSEDYMGRFMADCLEDISNSQTTKTPCKEIYQIFKWWWGENMDDRENWIPAMKTINANFRERGFEVDPSGGKYWVHKVAIKYEIAMEVKSSGSDYNK